jgi:primase-polymerase (primpol)-like protein
MTDTEPESGATTESTDSTTKAGDDTEIVLNTDTASEEMLPDSVVVPPSIKHEKRWICYRIEEQSGKPKKIPKAPRFNTQYGSKSLFNVDPTSTDHVTTFYEARAFDYRSREELDDAGADGVGLTLTTTDDIVGVDLDDCYDVESGEIERWAYDIIRHLDSYTEVSPSGTGLHVLVRGEIDERYGNKHEVGLEIYEADRYFTFTGDHLEQTPDRIHQRGDTVREIQRTVMSESVSSSEEAVPTDSSTLNQSESHECTAPEPAEFGPEEEEIMKTASEADDEFAPLFEEGSIREYDNDHSRADYALACKLAYWCRGDVQQMDAIFRESALMRPKWDEKRGSTTYGRYTLEKACRENSERYGGDW